ncbi:MAG: ATP-binding cassette domain-containing protein [Planctomycetes bacterium]|nr:ATP-binding cassette domain-containing protein [Planctomycetota bacterium]
MTNDAAHAAPSADPAAPSAPPLLEIRDLHKTLGGKHVLKGVNLSVERGETLVIIGGSGCGKSVLLKHVMGILEPDRGSIKVEGREIVGLRLRELNEVRHRFALIFQGGALFDSLTVAENIGFYLMEHERLPWSRIYARVLECLEKVKLGATPRERERIAAQMPADLSGGMKKRVAIARALAPSPEFLLWDEPTTGLDPPTADAINDQIIMTKTADGARRTSLVVTHDMASAMKVGDRVAFLFDGRILKEFAAAEIGAYLKLDPDAAAGFSVDERRVWAFVKGRADRVLEAGSVDTQVLRRMLAPAPAAPADAEA